MRCCTAKRPKNPLKSVIIPLSVVILIALLMRMLSYASVTANGGITFLGYDDFYHMRRILYTTFNFPNALNFDSYLNYPYGFEIGWPPLFDLLGATLAKILGVGQPDIHTIEFAGALLPVLLGILTIIPLYVVTTSLFDRKTGLLAASIFAVMPAHLFISRFGAVDHHVAEAFLSTTAFAFFILALKWAREGDISFSSFKTVSSEKKLIRSLAAAILSGLFFALLIFTWVGALVFVSFIVLYVFVQTTMDLRVEKKSDYLYICAFVNLLATLLFTVPIVAISARPGLEMSAMYLSWFQVIYIFAMLAGTLLLWVFSTQFSKRELDWKYYPAALIVLFGAGLILVRIFSTGSYAYIIEGMRFFSGTGEYIGTISEAVPLFLTPQGTLTLSSVLGAFGLSLIAAFAGLFVLGLEWKGENSKPERLFFLLWTLFFIYLALSQRRFSYLLATNVSILTAYLLWVLMDSLDFEVELGKLIRKLKKEAPKAEKNTLPTDQNEKEAKAKTKSKSRTKNETSKNAPKLRAAKTTTSSKKGEQPDYFKIFSSIALMALIFVPCILIGMTSAKDSADVDSAWQESLKWLETSSPETSYYLQPSEVPEYGVLSWWDYGNWILYMSKRPVVSNNFQTGVEDSANFFLAGSEQEAKAIMDKLKVKYVITDNLISQLPKGKFGAMVALAGKDIENYYDIKTVNKGGTLQTAATPKKEYFNTQVYKLQELDGTNLGNLRLVHESAVNATENRNEKNSIVKIFEYVPGAKLSGTTTPNQAITVSLDLVSNTGRKFTYKNTAVTGQAGLFEITVPYSTENTGSKIIPASTYSLSSGENVTATGIQVKESDILNGSIIKVG